MWNVPKTESDEEAFKIENHHITWLSRRELKQLTMIGILTLLGV